MKYIQISMYFLLVLNSVQPCCFSCLHFGIVNAWCMCISQRGDMFLKKNLQIPLMVSSHQFSFFFFCASFKIFLLAFCLSLHWECVLFAVFLALMSRRGHSVQCRLPPGMQIWTETIPKHQQSENANRRLPALIWPTCTLSQVQAYSIKIQGGLSR